MKFPSVTAFLAAIACSFVAVANDKAPACPPPPSMPEATKMQELAKSAKDRGFLWKIEKDGRTSYLYGTIHANTLDWMMFGPKTMTAIREADTIAVELNPLDPEVQATMREPGKLGLTSPPLGDKLKARLGEQLKRACVPAQVLPILEKRPAMMQVAGAMLFDARFIGLEASYGNELFLIGLAQGARKPLASLESAAQQMRAFAVSDTSSDEVEGALAQIENGNARKMLARLHAAWGASNANDFENMGAWCECLDTEVDRKYMQRINDDRNPNLAKGIDKLHGEGKRVFAAVGTLHMFGAKGLPKLLREMGYSVERVSFDADAKK